MGIFGKNQKQPALPNNIVDIMERFGRIGFDSSRGKDVGDVGEIWGELAGQVLPVARADPESFLVALANAVVPVGGWAVYGASRMLWEALSLTEEFGQNPSYNAIMNAGIDFLRMNRVPSQNVSGYEWQHWIARGGTRETWLP